jgi:putative spermidine/putrescine transport system substrate-binding protein
MKRGVGQGISRRSALGGLGAGVVAIGAPAVWSRAAAQSKRIVVRDAGGPYTKAFTEAFYKPFQEATGVEVVAVTSAAEPTSQIKSMVEAKANTWDIAGITLAATQQLVADGDYLVRHELEKADHVSEIPPQYMSPYCVGTDVYATILAYRTDKGAKKPAGWKDFWDLDGFPGRRAMRKHPFDTIEEALLADGVEPSKLYPCDFGRAYRSLDRIKPKIAAWWAGGAQVTQMMVSGEVDMVPVWLARAQAAIAQNAPLAVMWDQNLWGVEGWAIIKGTPHVEICREFIKFASDAKRQAAFTPYFGNGPTNPNAYKHIDPKRGAELPTYPDNRARGIAIDNAFWAANKEKAIEQFNVWILK